jgi:prepilin peptidase CpaA
MFEWTAQHIVFIVGVGLLTSIAAYTDTRFWKIPNKLTVPFFVMGLIYQVAFWGWNGLGDGLGGFALGFGTYLLLFLVAGGGGGDVKLMGSISVWMGIKMTLLLMIFSTLIVIVDVAIVTLYKVVRYGTKKWKQQHLATGKQTRKPETIAEKQARRFLPFAVPVGTAAWLLMLLNGAGFIKDGQLGPPRANVQQQAQVER